jgi:hypothetical protein
MQRLLFLTIVTLLSATGLAIDHIGNLYVSNWVTTELSSSTKTLFTWAAGMRAPCMCSIH